MELTQEQRLILTQRIADEFEGFVKEELQYQVESMSPLSVARDRFSCIL